MSKYQQSLNNSQVRGNLKYQKQKRELVPQPLKNSKEILWTNLSPYTKHSRWNWPGNSQNNESEESHLSKEFKKTEKVDC